MSRCIATETCICLLTWACSIPCSHTTPVPPRSQAPSAPPNHGFVGGGGARGGGGGGGGGDGAGGRGAGAKNALPWAAFDIELGKDLHLPPIAQGGGGGPGGLGQGRRGGGASR